MMRAKARNESCTFQFLPAAVLCLALCQGVMNAERPPIKITSLDAAAVNIAGPSSFGFGRALRQGRDPGFEAVLPYTVAITNNSPREILAYTVLWYCTDVNGYTITQTRSVFNFSNLRPGAHLVSKASELVALYPTIEAGTDWGTVEGSVKDLVEFYNRQRHIEIVLDSVLFDDGSAVGPDHGRWIEKWQAWLEAEKSVFGWAVSSSVSAPDSGVRRLAEHGSHLYRDRYKGNPSNSGVFAMLADCSAGYAECLEWATAYYSSSILEEAAERGEEAVTQNLRAVLQGKKYPTVHRKEQSDAQETK